MPLVDMMMRCPWTQQRHTTLRVTLGIPSLKFPPERVPVAQQRLLVLCIGGFNGNGDRWASQGEVYSTNSESWTPISEMACKKSGFGVGV